MNLRPATPLEAQRLAQAAIGIDKARLSNALHSIARTEGYDRAVEASQQALRSLAALLREEGVSLGDYL